MGATDTARFNAIPDQMRGMRRWATYKLEPKPGTPGKFNKLPRGSRAERMRWSDPSNWLTYEQALTAVRAMPDKLDGIGFFLGDGVHGLDIDGCITSDGMDAEAQNVIMAMNSYTELSPSGTGIHILFSAPRFDFKGKDRRREDTRYELYDGEESPRFFTVTGNALGGYTTLTDASEAVAQVYERFVKARIAPSVVIDRNRHIAENVRRSMAYQDEYDGLTDADIAEWMADCEPKYGELYFSQGAWEYMGYQSQSQADQALCNALVRYCHGDADRVDRMFRQSALMRDKWEHNRSAREHTLAKATAGYDPSKAPNYGAWKRSRGGYEALQTDHKPQDVQKGTEVGEKTKEAVKRLSVASYNAADFMGEAYEHGLKEYAEAAKVKTGFRFLDSKMGGLMPGLYVLGAQPGGGKTTFAWQIAENLSAQGRQVLYFALEQGAMELVTKSVARHAYQLSGNEKGSPSANEIRRGASTPHTEKARDVFRKAGSNIEIIEGSLGLTVETLKCHVEQWIAERKGARPVIFLDYLQLLDTEDPYARDRARVDKVVKALKNLQRDLKLVMIAIVSFNRDGYGQKTEMGSIKESGNIEFTADCVLGLDPRYLYQPPLMDEAKGGLKAAWERTRDAWAKQYPRTLMIHCVKNRFGDLFDSAITYHSRHDLFVEPCEDMAEALDLNSPLDVEQKAGVLVRSGRRTQTDSSV